MLIAVEGCAHGELEKIYECIEHLESVNNVKVDLLICCGDFQSVRNNNDLFCMAVPAKYHDICSFYKYYSGEKVAPVLTLFIGGNHEASNYLQELPYGGWVAPNIYYLGHAGVVTVAGIRIAGLSGIYKGHDYMKGHFEVSPYNDNTKRSVYHIRNLEVFRLKQLSGEVSAILSHDWPRGVAEHGDLNGLLKFKPYFEEEIRDNKLGSAPGEELLHCLKPEYWFAGHLHCQYAALVPHKEGDGHTKFLALDKCLPKRRFLQVLTIKHDDNQPIELKYDLEWLSILHLTNHLLSVRSTTCYMPGNHTEQRFNFTPSKDEKNLVLQKLGGDLTIPLNFTRTAEVHSVDKPSQSSKRQPAPVLNPQTSRLCDLLQLDDPVSLTLLQAGNVLQCPSSPIASGILENFPLTPENAASETFCELSPDTFALSSPITPLNLRTPKLSLPKPKLDEEIHLSDEEAGEVVPKKLFIEDVSGCTPVVLNCTTPVSLKKPFKRRNQSLYVSKSDDE